MSIASATALQTALEPYFSTDERLEALGALLLALGGALIGATAIAFSLVMFAMQVNVERMPHGLFRKFSSDRRLLGAFVGAFLLAIAVAVLSLTPKKTWLAVSVLGAGWGTALILILFHYAYRRALSLINPIQQLGIVVEDARKAMGSWARRAQRAAPILEDLDIVKSEQASPTKSNHDITRAVYFGLNPHWTAEARQAIMYTISFARRYAEQGDHEISGAALSAVVSVNAWYVETKGRTFFARNPIIDSPQATDGFINETLEHLRQNAQVGISRGDERQIEQTLNAIAALVQVYMSIDYANDHAPKTHAHLAAGYLSGAVQRVVPHNMADVLMEGVRLMGRSAHVFLDRAEPNDIATLADKIGAIAVAGVVKQDYRPVTLAGIDQLAKLTFDLIRVKRHDIHFAAGELKRNVSMIANVLLTLPDTPLWSIHTTYLAPYYSGTSTQTLQAQLTDLTNALVEAKPDDEDARTIIRNIRQWSEDLSQTEKKLFLTAIERKSHFTFDMIHWIAHITKILLALSNAPACDDYTKGNLQKNALWLVSVLSWVRDDADTVAFVENLGMTEVLFGAAVDAHRQGCDEVLGEVCNILLSWAFKAGIHQIGRATFERSLYALATLALARGGAEDGSRLVAAITARLASENAPSEKIRDRAARAIRSRAAMLNHEQYRSSGIEIAMARADHSKLRPLLEQIANLLSPERTNKPVEPDSL